MTAKPVGENGLHIGRRGMLALLGLVLTMPVSAQARVKKRTGWIDITHEGDRLWGERIQEGPIGSSASYEEPVRAAPLIGEPQSPPLTGIRDEAVARRQFAGIRREEVPFAGYQPGTVIVDTRAKRLYLVDGNGMAIRYAIAVGREGFKWTGTETVSNKREWPDWIPPAEMRERQLGLPKRVPGGLSNPLGARALYLGSTLYRIHGTNDPGSIGRSVSSGCIRMANADAIDLFDRVPLGATVVVK